MTAIQAVVANLRQADATEVAHREHFEALFARQADSLHQMSILNASIMALADQLIAIEGEEDE